MRKFLIIILIIVLILLISVLLFRIIRKTIARNNCEKLKGGKITYNDFFNECLALGQPCRGIIQGFYKFAPNSVILRKNNLNNVFMLICGNIVNSPAYPVEFTPVKAVFVVKFVNIPEAYSAKLNGVPVIDSKEIYKKFNIASGENVKELKRQLKEYAENDKKQDITVDGINFLNYTAAERVKIKDLDQLVEDITDERKKLLNSVKIFFSDFNDGEFYKNYLNLSAKIPAEIIDNFNKNENPDFLKSLNEILAELIEYRKNPAENFNKIIIILNKVEDLLKLTNNTTKTKTKTKTRLNLNKIRDEISIRFKQFPGQTPGSVINNLNYYFKEYTKSTDLKRLFNVYFNKIIKYNPTFNATYKHDLIKEIFTYINPEKHLSDLFHELRTTERNKINNKIINPIIKTFNYIYSGEYATAHNITDLTAINRTRKP